MYKKVQTRLNNFLLTEVKLELHGLHYVKITYDFFQRRRQLRAVAQRAIALEDVFQIRSF